VTTPAGVNCLPFRAFQARQANLFGMYYISRQREYAFKV
jgi:hypothetical protein